MWNPLNRWSALLCLCLVVLSGCSATPRTVYVEPVCPKIPQDMLTECPMPDLMGDTYGDVVEWSVSLVTALKECNARMAVIRAD